MVISEITTKIIVFKHETGLTQGAIARELGITEQHLSSVLCAKYPISNKLESSIRDMFKRYSYIRALDDRGEL